MRSMFVSVAMLALSTVAQATTQWALDQGFDGNYSGLSYRPSDGHFLMTQDTAGIVEYSASGQLLRTVAPADLSTDFLFFSGVHQQATVPGLVVAGVTFLEDESGTTTLREFVRVSSGLDATSSDTYTDALNALPFDEEPGKLSDASFLTFNNLLGTVSGRTWSGDTLFSVDLASRMQAVGGASDACFTEGGRAPMCLNGLAYAANGGFYALDEGNTANGYVGRLMEFNPDGSLRHATSLDPSIFDNHPQAIDTDLANGQIFIAFNNSKVVTFSEAEFLAMPSISTAVPEAGTAPMWLLGVGAVFFAVLRNRATPHGSHSQVALA